MNDAEDLPFDDDAAEAPSKSQLKRDMHALQALATRLTELSDAQLARIPMSPELEKAVREARTITKREALRRHRQFLGKLMRNADHAAIAEAVEAITEQHHQTTRLSHVMEQWRDELVTGDDQTVTRFVDEFPDVDRQQLRQLVRAAKIEAAANKPPASARKLFRLIRAEVSRRSVQ